MWAVDPGMNKQREKNNRGRRLVHFYHKMRNRPLCVCVINRKQTNKRNLCRRFYWKRIIMNTCFQNIHLTDNPMNFNKYCLCILYRIITRNQNYSVFFRYLSQQILRTGELHTYTRIEWKLYSLERYLTQ